MSDFRLADAQYESFMTNGFLGPIKVYEPEDARERWKKIHFEMSSKRSQVYPESKLNYDRHLDCDLLSEHACNPRVVDKLQRLIGPDVLCWRSEFFPKKPGSPGTEWHQVEDWSYANGAPELVATRRIDGVPTEITVWTAWTRATKENGCLKFMPGSHRHWHFDERKEFKSFDDNLLESGFFGYSYADKKIDPNWEPEEDKAVYLEMEPGECVIFTARCMHGSAPNTTQSETRYASSTRYVPCSSKVYPDMPSIEEHGERLDLSRFGTVLVAGRDEYGFNKLHDRSLTGFEFSRSPRLEAVK